MRTSHWKRAVAFVMLACLGCAWKGGATQHPRICDQMWQIVPVRIRVYPSSHFTRDQDQLILEARIELFDEMGDSVKGAGIWHFELYAHEQTGELSPSGIVTSSTRRPIAAPRASDELLYSWDVTMLSLDQNQRFYDPITRTYLFRLNLEDGSTSPTAVKVHIIFTRPDGKRLQATSIVPMKL